MKSNVVITIAIIVLSFGALIGFVIFRDSSPGIEVPQNNVSVVEGKQFIEILAKGGYFPRVSEAKADIPNVVRINTKGTFDCSLALTIPAVGYRSILPQTGATEIEVPPQKAGSIVQGVCSMGMYSFTIKFI